MHIATVDSAWSAFMWPITGAANAWIGSTVAMCMHYIGLDQLDAAQLVQMDRLGLTVQCERLGQTFKMRLPFPRAAEDRKDVKTLIVEMTKASMGDPKVQEWAEAKEKEAEAQAA